MAKVEPVSITFVKAKDIYGIYVNGILLLEGKQLTALDVLQKIYTKVDFVESADDSFPLPFHLETIKQVA